MENFPGGFFFKGRKKVNIHIKICVRPLDYHFCQRFRNLCLFTFKSIKIFKKSPGKSSILDEGWSSNYLGVLQ